MTALYWTCSSCRAEGVVDLPGGYYSIVFFFERLRTAHDHASPDCAYDPERIQIGYEPLPEAGPCKR